MPKRILNPREEATQKRLAKVCDAWGAQVFAKPRLADVLPIENSGISSAEYSYALRAHFDLVVADSDSVPLFAVEFDGVVHESSAAKKRDAIKDGLCRRFDFPILRIKSQHLLRRFRHVDLLTWIVECWFLERGFDEAQARGDIPLEEGFDPLFLTGPLDSKATFPLWLSLEVRNRVRSLAKSGKIRDPIPTLFVGSDDEANVFAMAAIMVDADFGVIGETGVRHQLFPFPIDELAEQLVFFDLHERLLDVLAGSATPLKREEIDARLRVFSKRYRVTMSMGYVPTLARIQGDGPIGG